MAELRTLIDFATGDNWEMPISLYEAYTEVCHQLKLTLPKGLTCIQYWMSTLTDEERIQIVKR